MEGSERRSNSRWPGFWWARMEASRSKRDRTGSSELRRTISLHGVAGRTEPRRSTQPGLTLGGLGGLGMNRPPSELSRPLAVRELTLPDRLPKVHLGRIDDQVNEAARVTVATVSKPFV